MLSWLNLIPSLPSYNGPYTVGSTEVEIPINALDLSHPDPPILTVKFRIFYPANVDKQSHRGIQWLPQPQDQYLNAAFKVAKIQSWMKSLARLFLWWVPSLEMPAYKDATLFQDHKARSVAIYSHGLMNWINSNSAVLGELASFGMISVAIEHRDGSGVFAPVRNGTGEKAEAVLPEHIKFKNISLKMRPHVMEQRDEQLRIRLFEITAVYKALELMNRGESLTNLAGTDTSAFRGQLDLTPGKVIWIGYSFGGSTIVQFIKSIYYGSRSEQKELRSLLGCTPPAELSAQITPESPVVLMDPWNLPLRSHDTLHLYNKPLPAYLSTSTSPAVCAIMTSEFAYHWPQCHSNIPAVLAADPALVPVETAEEYEAMTKAFRTANDFVKASMKDQARFAAQSNALKRLVSQHADLYVFRDTTHTTLCDYGLLTPWGSYIFGGQRDAVSATSNVVRCILKVAGHNEYWNAVPSNRIAADAQLIDIKQ